MSPDTCIYYAGGLCLCRHYCRVRPNCPHYRRGECRCEGKLGRLDGGRERRLVTEEPAPTLLRWRAS